MTTPTPSSSSCDRPKMVPPKSSTSSPPSQEPPSTIPTLSSKDKSTLRPLLQSFTIRHQSHHRPIALVTSGGTATDLEINSVRFLDNFSTGLRGAVSVEQFLKRGYAVIHLWRVGSASPYSRVVSSMLGVRQANHGLGVDCLGRLFHSEHCMEEEEENEEEEKEEDPWLTSTNQTNKIFKPNEQNASSTTATDEPIKLSRHLLNSTILQRTIREYNQIKRDGLLLTIPFRTVEEYLAKLAFCTTSLKDSQSLAVVYLAAAVSDFYIPKTKRSLHKIQSQEYDIPSSSSSSDNNDEKQHQKHAVDDENCLTLKLHPVPKCIPLLRTTWCPDAFVVSFKLETDKTILKHKAIMAMEKYKVHVVIGNVLDTRHEKVWVMHPKKRNDGIDYKEEKKEEKRGGNEEEQEIYEMKEITKSGSGAGSGNTSMIGSILGAVRKSSSTTTTTTNPTTNLTTIDELEDSTINYIVQRHFEYIANHFPGTDASSTSTTSTTSTSTSMSKAMEASKKHNEEIQSKKEALQKELYWKHVKSVSYQVLGSVVGMALSYGIGYFLQNRIFSVNHRQHFAGGGDSSLMGQGDVRRR